MLRAPRQAVSARPPHDLHLTGLSWGSDRRLVRWGGILTGICLALYLPQFFGPPPVRIAHGLLLAVGCLWLAAGLWTRRAARPAASDNGQRTAVVPVQRSAPS
jgi:hypothetical protein